MTQFNVQFDRSNFDVRFEIDSIAVPFSVIKKPSANEKQILQQQQQNAALLQKIQQHIVQSQKQIEQQSNEIANVAIRHAENFIQFVFQNDSELILQKLKQQITTAFSTLDLAPQTHIWVHPDFISSLNEHFSHSQLENVTIQPDPLLDKSDCRVEGVDSGWIARIENQLELARQTTFQQMEHDES